MEVIDLVEACASEFAQGRPTLDLVAVTELNLVLDLFDRWSRNPVLAGVQATLKSPTEYVHATLMLATASFLADAGNAVELVPAPHDHRKADLEIYTGSATSVTTELKVPEALVHPSEPLTDEGALSIVQRAIKKARGGGHGGQLPHGQDAILVIGGFGLRETDLEYLCRGAEGEIARHATERRHIIGVGFVSIGILVGVRDSPLGRSVESINSTLGVRMVLNDSYSGDLSVQQDEASRSDRLRPIEGELQDTTLEDIVAHRRGDQE